MSQQFTEEGMDAAEKALDATARLGERLRKLEALKAELSEALIVLTAGVEVAGLHIDIPDAYQMALAAIAKAEGLS